MKQRLMLPRPGILLLVLSERADARYQQPTLPAGAQPDIHFIESSRTRMHGEQVNTPLREPNEEHLVIDRTRPVSLLPLTARIVQEHQVEVRRVPQLHATQLAVTQRGDSDRA